MSFDGEGSDRTVFVGGVSPKATEEGLKQFFESNFGEVDSSKIIYDRSTGRSKGYGFITFHDAETADRVRNSSGLVFLGKVLNIGNAYRRHARHSGNFTQSEVSSSTAGAPATTSAAVSGDYGGYGGGYPSYAYNPYYAPYAWPSPIPPPSAGETSTAGQPTQPTPEQIQAYQAQLQAMMQAQLVMWQQMQQSPAAMQQLASQFQTMSLGQGGGAYPPSAGLQPPAYHPHHQPQHVHHAQISASLPSDTNEKSPSNGNGKAEATNE